MATHRRKRMVVEYATDLALGTDPRTVYKVERVPAEKYSEMDYMVDRVRVVVLRIDDHGSRSITDIIEAGIRTAEKWLEAQTGALVRIPVPYPYHED